MIDPRAEARDELAKRWRANSLAEAAAEEAAHIYGRPITPPTTITSNRTQPKAAA